MPFSICSIIAKNYISFARTLCNSFLAQHPDGVCYVLIIDVFDRFIDSTKENFRIVRLTDLPIPNLREFCFKYTVTETATAAKPYLIEHLFDRFDLDKVLYFDPDILILNKLDELYQELDRFNFVLTPHIDKDYPNDGCEPNDSKILTHGIFNLGFIGLKNSAITSEFLSWWQNKLYNKCLIDYRKGYFVDQKFIDIAITIFKNCGILKRPGYNVAYWNLHSRKITLENSLWKCNDDKLFFYHFSSYRMQEPYIISRHQTRFEFEQGSVIDKLFSYYRAQLEQNAYKETIQWPYTYNYFTNGRKIIPLYRRICKNKIRKIGGPDPFEFSLYPLSYRIALVILEVLRSAKNHLLTVR